MKKRSKRYKEIKKQSVRNTKLKINEAIDLVKKTSQLNLMSLLILHFELISNNQKVEILT